MFFFRKLLHTFGVRHFAPPEPSVGMKLSEAIRKGAEMGWYEDHVTYNHCALGTAYKGKTGRSIFRSGHYSSRVAVAEEFNVPMGVVVRVDCLHQQGMSRLAIADLLEKEGF